MTYRNFPRAVPCHPRDYLLNGGTLAGLQETYAIDVRRHGHYPNLVHLKYNQIESPMGEPLVQQCRGLILDQDEDWRIVAWPFNKFFNHGEPNAAKIDWITARVQEKLDGSLMVMYWYDEGWQVATSGMPDAAGTVHGTGMSFAQLFWETWYRQKLTEPASVHRSYTFMFELTSPYNRVVVQHLQSSLTLTGVRNIWSGSEMPVEFRQSLNPVKEFGLQSLGDIVGTFEGMDPLAQEGYVVVDINFNRVKVKHPGYVALHHLKSHFSVKRIVEVVRTGESEEVLVHFPEWKTPFEQVRAAFDGFVAQLEQDHAELESLKGNRKEFAMLAKQSIWPAAHFMMLDSHVRSVREALRNVHIEKMVDLLGVRGLVLEGAI